MLELKNISKDYDDFKLSNVNLQVEKGEYFVVLGTSGVGKSILLETIAGFSQPDSGSIILDGIDITHNKIQKRNLGFLHQKHSLFPHLSIYKNIQYGLNNFAISKKEKQKIINILADDFGIKHLLHRKPEALSGGEIQRVSLARITAIKPEYILLDEPLSQLDTYTSSEIRRLLRKINRRGVTIIHVTHNYEEAVSLAGKIAVMENGSIIQTDYPEIIFKHPKSQFVANFIGIKNFIRGSLHEVHGSDVSRFSSNNINFHLLTDKEEGSGFLIIRSEDISISKSKPKSSALNVFKGIIIDIAPARLGIEITVDIGVELTSLITRKSLNTLKLNTGREVWINFKASAAKFLME